MSYNYDEQNIFAKILRGEIPNSTVAETQHTLAFRDIAPQAPTHIIVIPKGPYVNFDHFSAQATDEELVDFARVAAKICQDEGLAQSHDGNGYRAISNAGAHGGQEVPHYHLHLLGGRPIGPMVIRSA